MYIGNHEIPEALSVDVRRHAAHLETMLATLKPILTSFLKCEAGQGINYSNYVGLSWLIVSRSRHVHPMAETWILLDLIKQVVKRWDARRVADVDLTK